MKAPVVQHISFQDNVTSLDGLGGYGGVGLDCLLSEQRSIVGWVEMEQRRSWLGMLLTRTLQRLRKDWDGATM